MMLLIRNARQSIADLVFLKHLWIQALTAFWEELFWRVLLQGLLLQILPAYLAIILTALLFWATHLHQFRRSKLRAVELFFFSLFLGVLFEFTYAFILCFGIHFIRNVMIILYRLVYSHFYIKNLS